MSLRAKRRSLIAALAVGGSLAVASSASAIPVPIGSSTDAAYSGSGTPSSVYSLYNAASGGLIQAQNLIVGANQVAAANHTTPVDSNFTSNFTSSSQLTSTNVAEIATDISTAANANNLEYALCIATEESHGAPAGTAFADCDTYPAPPSATYQTAFTTQVQPEVASAAASWGQLSLLVGFLGNASGTLQSADSATVSSSGTVVSTTAPFAYDIKLTAPAGGYIVPSAFSLTFPAGLGVNVALVADEVNAATNTAAVELNPTGTPIGTVTLTSPLAHEFGGSNNQLVGKIYVVQTGQSSGQGSVTQPYLELWFPGDGSHPIYALGSFGGALSFPAKITFGEAYVSLLGTTEPLPLNSIDVSFPAATSPVKASSCTSLGTVAGSVTDSIAGLAYEFGDTSDGASSATSTGSEVQLAATPTAVTNHCASLTGTMGGLTTGTPTMTLKIKTGSSFGTVTVGLPKGMSFVKSKKFAKDVKAAGAKIKSVRIVSGKLVIGLKSKVTSVTIKTVKPLIHETAALVRSIKKHKTKTLSVGVHAGSIALKATIKA